MRKNIIVFDTNIWIRLLSTNNNPPKYNMSYLDDLKKTSILSIFNISVIECLMRYKRKNNINKIKEIVSYIKNNNIYIGQISCTNFDTFPNSYSYLLELTDNEIMDEIDKFQEARLGIKCSVISLWIECLIEIFLMAILDTEEDYNKIFTYASSKFKVIYEKIYKFFCQNELQDEDQKNGMCDIVNKTFKDIVFNINIEEFKYNRNKYNDLCIKLENLETFQSISYIYKGIYKSKFMNIYNQKIDASLRELFDNKLFTEIFHERLKIFMQGEPLQKNDVEDMLMISTLELDKNNQMTIVTGDKKMNKILQKLNAQNSDEIYKKIFTIV